MMYVNVILKCSVGYGKTLLNVMAMSFHKRVALDGTVLGRTRRLIRRTMTH